MQHKDSDGTVPAFKEFCEVNWEDKKAKEIKYMLKSQFKIKNRRDVTQEQKIYQITTALEDQRIRGRMAKGDFKNEQLGIQKEAVNTVEE